MQRSCSVLALGRRVGAVLDEKPRQIYITPEGCPMRWSHPVLTLCCRVDAVLEEEPRQTYMTLFGRPM